MNIRWSGTPEALQDRLAQLPDAIAGRVPDTGGAIRWLMVRVALTFLSLIKESFVTKSEGGTDAMGVRWPALAAATLILRRIVSTPASIKRLKAKLAKFSPHQRRRLIIHARRLAGIIARSPLYRQQRRFALRILEKKRRAGSISPAAYNQARKRLTGPMTAAKAKREIIAGAFALILRDTGRLLNSLSPILGAPGQVVNIAPGRMEIGSNVRTRNGRNLLDLHDSDRPRKISRAGKVILPRRQVLPESESQMPVVWVQRMTETLERSIASREFLLMYLGSQAS